MDKAIEELSNLKMDLEAKLKVGYLMCGNVKTMTLSQGNIGVIRSLFFSGIQ